MYTICKYVQYTLYYITLAINCCNWVSNTILLERNNGFCFLLRFKQICCLVTP